MSEHEETKRIPNKVDASINVVQKLKDFEYAYSICTDMEMKAVLAAEICRLKADKLFDKKEQLEFNIAVAIGKLMLDFQEENNVKIKYLNLHLDEQSGKSFIGSVNIEL